MGLSVLFNIPSLQAQNQLSQTSNSLQNALTQLTTGSRINSGADDPAGLQISNLLNASVAALNQSVNNASNGVGLGQVADGALSQVSNLLNTAVSLATEAANGGLSSQQVSALQNEFAKIQSEIDNIGTNTNFNGTGVFTTAITSIFLTDLATNYDIGISASALSASGLGVGAAVTLNTTGAAASALAAVNSAIATVAQQRGSIGAAILQLQDGQNVDTVESQNTTNALNTITAANIPQVVSNLSKFSILDQTGIYSLTQANALPQNLLKLLG
jgi:flagellin